MKKFICECCGGQINPTTLKCDYCGTQYKNEYDSILRVETYTNPVDTYASQVAVSRHFIKDVGEEETSKYVIESLTQELAKAIAHNMVITARNDMEHYTQTFTGTIKVIRPEKIGTGWYRE